MLRLTFIPCLAYQGGERGLIEGLRIAAAHRSWHAPSTVRMGRGARRPTAMTNVGRCFRKARRWLEACWLLGVGLSFAASAAARVEIALAHLLDEERGFCIDIVGAQARARPAIGVQAHTCYSYQGRIAVDQAFDATRLRAGTLLMPSFNVCLAANAQERPSVSLQPCDGSAQQRFRLTARGLIVSAAYPGHCITVSSAMGRPIGGGRPPHLIRGLALRPCHPDRAVFQTWQVREAPPPPPRSR